MPRNARMATGPLQEYMRKSREDLAKALVKKDRLEEHHRKEAKSLQETTSEVVGVLLTAPSAAVVTGFVEERFRNPDGGRASLGPMPLPVAAGLGYLAMSLVMQKENPLAATQLRYAASANLGIVAADFGRRFGFTRLSQVLARQQPAGPVRISGVDPGRTRQIPGHDPVPRRQERWARNPEDDWSPEERELMMPG